MSPRTNNVNISDDLRTFAEAEAAKHGMTSASEYVESLLREAKNRTANGSSIDRASVSKAIAELDQLRIGNRLDGLSIRQLIEEGRRN